MLAFENVSKGLVECPRVFCVPGRYESYRESVRGLGFSGHVEIGGIDFTDAFSNMRFSDQVDLIAETIVKYYWSDNDLLLGRSFGAWILLNAMMKNEAKYPGTAILICSVLGFGGHSGLRFSAPRAVSFWNEARSRSKPPARRLALIHAVDDDQCPCKHAARLSEIWNLELIHLGKPPALPGDS